jgi:hypothetical protein
MESTGEASKVHITSEVNDELTKIGGFKTESRGKIDVKVDMTVKSNFIKIVIIFHFRERA